MTPLDIRIAVAKVLGWTRIEQGPCPQGREHSLFTPWTLGGTPPQDRDKPEDEQSFAALPDWPSSLDACALMEEYGLINDSMYDIYLAHLERICGSTRAAVLSEPLQRCEALLRIHGLWVEGAP